METKPTEIENEKVIVEEATNEEVDDEGDEVSEVAEVTVIDDGEEIDVYNREIFDLRFNSWRKYEGLMMYLQTVLLLKKILAKLIERLVQHEAKVIGFDYGIFLPR